MPFNTTIASNIGCTLPHDINEDQWLWYNDYSWWVEGFGSVLIGIVGIVLNLISSAVLLGSSLGGYFFNWLLVCLAVFDSLFLLSGIAEAFRSHIGGASSYEHHYAFAIFLYPFRSVVLGCSMYMTIILALERYNAFSKTSSQFQSIRHNTLCKGRLTRMIFYLRKHHYRLFKYVSPGILLSTLFYAPKYLELHVVKKERCNSTISNYDCDEYSISLTSLRKSNVYVLWYLNVANLIVTSIIPLCLLVYLNYNVHVKFKQFLDRQASLHNRLQSTPSSSKEKHHRHPEKDVVQQTMILFVIVISFVLSHALRVCLNIEELKSLNEEKEAIDAGCEWVKFWTIIVYPISHLLLQINSGTNFFVYCIFNQQFRNTIGSTISGLFGDTFFGRGLNDQNTTTQAVKDSQQMSLAIV